MFGIRSGTFFLARLILGYIFIMHGWQKLHTNGIDATERAFDSMGIPAPNLAAQYATWVEFVGGILLILGLFLPIVAILLIADMIGAIAYAHWDAGFWAADGGYELPLALIGGLLAVGFAQAGSAAADHYVFRRRRRGAVVD
ncbi:MULTISPECIES: DoxX family protein [Gordonia]|jgi:putative oxidoreductase|uniref:DoxX family protein n=1 Tax=Gordonia tangerina TaxID=2911060 RepID=A0ABS9DE03_9ACTN|nr:MULTISPECIES: DoxX family protein [Gordonia]MAU83378.1 DoxX family protein [Gordonia sp. (in: high G+C Gram-positive bacteria)]MCF3937226.1 DoxX family protein [Gordonia tangerina]